MSERTTPKALSVSQENGTETSGEKMHQNEVTSKHFVATDGSAHPVVSFVDMDGDGDKDIVVDNMHSASSYWVENTHGVDAHAVFSQSIFKHIVPTAMGIGDIDSDGNLDMVLGYSTGAKIFLNDGYWSMQSVNAIMDNPSTIILQDFTEDGLTDILIQDERQLTLYQNMNGQFGAVTMSWPDLDQAPVFKVNEQSHVSLSMKTLAFDERRGVFGFNTLNGHSWKDAIGTREVGGTILVLADTNSDGVNDVFIQDEDGNKVWMESSDHGGVVFHHPGTAPGFDDSNNSASPIYTLHPDRSPSPLIPTSEHVDAVADVTPGPTAMSSPEPKPSLPDSPEASDQSTPDNATFDNDPKLSPDTGNREDASEFSPFPDKHSPTPPPPTVTTAEESSWQWDLTDDLYSSSFQAATGIEADFTGFDWTDSTMICSDVYYAESNYAGVYVVSFFGNDILMTGRGDDCVYAGGGKDLVMGGKGQDIIFGESGDDSLFGQSGPDFISGGGGKDFMFGGQHHDVLFGNSGHDTISGGDGDDYITGGKGDDLISGGNGMDNLRGDSGHDTFHFSSPLHGGDVISDFSTKDDTLEFSFGKDAAFYSVGDDRSTHFDGEGDAFIWEKSDSGGTLYYDEDVSTIGNEWHIADIYTTDEEELTVEDLIAT